MTRLDGFNRWALKDCERRYQEPQEETSWPTEEEEAYWAELDRRCDQAMEEARETFEKDHAPEIQGLSDWEDFLRCMGWEEG